MSYIENNLLLHEDLIFCTRPHWIIFAPPVFTFILALLILGFGRNLGLTAFQLFGFWLYQLAALLCLITGIVTIIKAYILYQTSEYGITNKRVLLKFGWIERNSLEMFLDKIEAIRVDQTIPGRVLGYGTIVVIGTGGTKDPFPNVPDPLAFRKKVQQQIDAANHQT